MSWILKCGLMGAAAGLIVPVIILLPIAALIFGANLMASIKPEFSVPNDKNVFRPTPRW